MIAIAHFRDSSPEFEQRAEAALAALAARPGYVRGTVGRSTDEPDAWVLFTEWRNIGSYRRALGDYQVKLHAAPLLAAGLDVSGAFESLVDVAPGGAATVRTSDLESGG